ncbi:MAG: HAMP domain-containing sensor histidine kinase [Burkholderiales bacterium]
MSRRAGSLLARAWPKSLIGRIASILFLALVAAHALTLLWLLGGRAELGRSIMFDYIGPDVASAIATLDRLPPSERVDWLPRLARPNYRYRLAEPPTAAIDSSALGRKIVESLSQAIGPSRVVAVQMAGERYAPNARVVHLRLADGSPVALELWPVDVGISMATAGVVLAQFALFATAAWYCVKLATRPLTLLAEAADALDPDRPAAALAESGPIEVSRAARAFNAMQQRISVHLAERAHILAAVSHDLQTPITRMRLRADLLDDGELRAKLLGDLAQMQALVEEGIAYARSAHAGLEEPRRVDLQALLDGLVCDYVDAGGAVTLLATTMPALTTRPQSLRRLTQNLIDNAIKFAGAAEVTVVETSEGIEIVVRDRGPGIPEEQHRAVLQPFHRLEDSRNRTSGGTGLGLAIADQLARALGGKLNLAEREGGGLEVSLLLPRA